MRRGALLGLAGLLGGCSLILSGNEHQVPQGDAAAIDGGADGGGELDSGAGRDGGRVDAGEPLDDGGREDAGATLCTGCDAAHCVDAACVVCTEATAATDCSGATSACDPITHTCVGCVTDGDCPLERPVCAGGGVCEECTADADCASRAYICDEASGACVQCDAATEEAQCGPNSCSRLTNTCTSTPRGSVYACQPCEADSECASDHLCVPEDFQGVSLGHFCMIEEGFVGCGDTVPNRQPLNVTMSAWSIDNVYTSFCFPPTTTTCTGVLNYHTLCATSADCGAPGVDDGYCPDSGPVAGLCSYPCLTDLDCPQTTSCGGTPPYCS